MKNETTIERIETKFQRKLQLPEYSEWTCHLFGGVHNGITWTPLKGEHPNWFWRKMQYLVFGHKWEKKEK